MGATYAFSCTKCGYATSVSGGPDRGMRVTTSTVLCGSCRELWDAEDGEYGQHTDPPKCPRNKRHKVLLWTHPGPCPRCAQGPLERSEGPELLWD